MGDRQSANLRNIVTIGFDRPITVSSSDSSHPVPGDDNLHSASANDGAASRSKNSDPPATCLIDHPKLVSSNLHFLKDVDLSIPGLANELSFVEAVATRNNPTTLDNLGRKLSMVPSYLSTSFTKDQQEVFCHLVDYAEMKQALRIELKAKEKQIREQEMKYLSTDFGLGNVVHGWDLSNSAGYLAGERQVGSGRTINRRKVKDADRIFSASSVMSFLSTARISKTKRSEIRKKKKEREKFKKHRKKQLTLQRHHVNGGRCDALDTEDESLAGGDEYTITAEKEREAQEEESEDLREMKNKLMMKKKMANTGKKSKGIGNRESQGAGKTSQHSFNSAPPKLMKNLMQKPEKPVGETGHRLRTLLTNKTPHHGSSSSSLLAQPLVAVDSSAGPVKEPILKLKIFKSRIATHGESPDVPPSPAHSITTMDSSPGTPNPHGGMPKRNRGRPRRLDT